MIKKLVILILALSYSLIPFANPEIEKTIIDSIWHKRIILLFDDNQNSANNQLKQWENVDFDEWDILVIKVSNDDLYLREKYQVNKDKTLSILIGKDGTEKWRANRLVDFGVLELLINKMPMRKNDRIKN